MELDHVVAGINAPIEAVWLLLADLGGVGRLFPPGGIPGLPALERVTLDGQGQGAVRTVYLADGSHVRERFDVVDPSNHLIQYVGVPPMPIKVDDYRATIKLSALGADKTRVDWSSTGIPAGATWSELNSILVAIHQGLIDGARLLCER